MPIRYRPYERRTLENLLAGSQAGLSPEIGYSIFSDVQGGALDRLAGRRDLRTQRTLRRQDLMPQLASFAAETATAGLPSSVAETAFSGYGPRIQGGLDQLLGDLYPAGASTSPFAVPPEGMTLTPEEWQLMDQDIQGWATGEVKQPNGLPMGLHEATMAIVSSLRVQGHPEELLERVRQFVEQRWQQYGGPPRPALLSQTSGTGTPSETVRRYGLGGGPLGGFLDSLR